MSDPFRQILGMSGNDSRQYYVDPERVTKEEYEAASLITDIIWGPDGLAEYLGPAWSMVHDPRFLACERSWVRETAGIVGGTSVKGKSLIDALDLRSKIQVIEDLALYADMIGEGRAFLEAARSRGIDPHDVASDEVLITSLMQQLCGNYQRRNGSWNDEAEALKGMLRAGLVGLIHDYSDISYSTDWIRMDTNEVVPPHTHISGSELEDAVPTVSVEIDNIHKALTMRAQVRMTAYRVLKQFPGIKASDLENCRLTDLESDQLCQTLFKAEMDKLYTVLPEIHTLVNRALTVPYEERETRQLEQLRRESQDFCTKLKSGEIERVATSLEPAGPDTAGSIVSLMSRVSTNEVWRHQYLALQMFEDDGDPEAKALAAELVQTCGAEEVWAKVVEFLTAKHTEALTERRREAIGNALDGGKSVNLFDPEVCGTGVPPQVPTVSVVEGVYAPSGGEA